MVKLLAITALAAACGGRARVVASSVAPGDELTLYRDAVFVHQRAEVDLAPGKPAHVEMMIATGVDADAIVVPDRGELAIQELHVGKSETAKAPTKLELVLSAAHAGHYVFHVAYLTDRITWEAAYTLTTSPARERATLRGAIAIANASGIALAHAHVTSIDAEIGNWRNKTMELLGGKLLGTPPNGTPPPTPRDLGTVSLERGETRLEMLAGAPAERMRSVLVYDPIGTKLDNPGSTPIRDTTLGMSPAPSTRVTESFEVERDQQLTSGLPGGPVRLLERRADGSLAVLGEARLFDVATRVAAIDTVPVGTAEGVTAHRERREITVDEDGKRVVEEFAISIENARPRPVEVVLHEHLYRSQNWSLAYHSALSAAKEGPQQIALRTTVPAKGQRKVLYVAVYAW